LWKQYFFPVVVVVCPKLKKLKSVTTCSIFVDVYLIQEPEIDLNEDFLDFQAEGTGVRGKNVYGFHIEFYLAIDEKVRPPLPYCLKSALNMINR